MAGFHRWGRRRLILDLGRLPGGFVGGLAGVVGPGRVGVAGTGLGRGQLQLDRLICVSSALPVVIPDPGLCRFVHIPKYYIAE